MIYIDLSMHGKLHLMFNNMDNSTGLYLCYLLIPYVLWMESLLHSQFTVICIKIIRWRVKL